MYYRHQLTRTYSRDLVLQGDSKTGHPSRCRLAQLLNLLSAQVKKLCHNLATADIVNPDCQGMYFLESIIIGTID